MNPVRCSCYEQFKQFAWSDASSVASFLDETFTAQRARKTYLQFRNRKSDYRKFAGLTGCDLRSNAGREGAPICFEESTEGTKATTVRGRTRSRVSV